MRNALQLQRKFRLLAWFLVALSPTVLLTACSETPQPDGMGGGMPPVPVNVVTVQPARADIAVELPGRVDAIKHAQIRARVNGIVQTINFQQGSDVVAGQLLFTIDPAPYEAARASAAAELQRAQASASVAHQLAQRYTELIKSNAISHQEYDNAVAQAQQADAAIAAAQAALQTADINLGYTRVTSPIAGRIGPSLVTEGALVSAANATLMANVQQISEVYVDVTRSSAELAAMRRDLGKGRYQKTDEAAAQVQLLLEDGSTYEQPGQMLFSGISVDPGTGQVTVRSRFANPAQTLLPGMYVRVRIPQAVNEQALLVPQQAVQRSVDGSASLMLVVDGKVQPRPVRVGPAVGQNWLIEEGVAAGDVVIVAGFQKARPGAPVQAMPWQAAGDAGQPASPQQPQTTAGAPSAS